MTKAIITGANGFVGSAVVSNLINHGYEVTVVLRNENSDISRLPIEKIKVLYSDVKDIKSLTSTIEEQYDVLFHFAWEGISGEKRLNTEIQLSNILSTIDAVEVAKSLGCTKFIGVGSIMEDESFELSKENKALPKNYSYGTAKLSAKLFSKSKANELNIEHVWVKITNAYGPYEFSPRLINSTLRKIYLNEYCAFTAGTQIYDFIYIDDVAEAFRLIAEKGHNNTTYLIGSGKAMALRNYLETIFTTVKTDVIPHFGDIPYKGVNLDQGFFSIETLKNDTGFNPLVSFEEGILKTYRWIGENIDAKV